ncbi:Ubiquitin carboxyl-terminal hydrolase 6 [Venturia nashicola]|nr:Ubiquitin carboxyl-terminal hydrolase 6 [Venturia nashicola]
MAVNCNMTVLVATVLIAAVCLFSTLTDAYVGKAHWRRDRAWDPASPNHHERYHSIRESHPEAKQSLYSDAHPRPSTPSRTVHRRWERSPTIIHTTYNGHSINATVVRFNPTSINNDDTTIRQKKERSQITKNPTSQHHLNVSIIPAYGNHTLFHTNRWRIDNTVTPFQQIYSPPNDTGVDLCLRACIEELKCAFAGFTQRNDLLRTYVRAGKLGPMYSLKRTCSFYASDIGAEKLEATNVDEKRILGPEFLAIFEDRVEDNTLNAFLKKGKWWRNDEAKPEDISDGYDVRAVKTNRRGTRLNALSTLSPRVPPLLPHQRSEQASVPSA